MNREYISAGVYVYESEFRATFTNLGTTSVGVVGESLRGQAFAPRVVTSYNDYVTKFGGMNATKLTDASGRYTYQKYEAPYLVNSYFEKGSSLYFTRVLGLSGYDAGDAFVLTLNDKAVAILRSRKNYTTNGIEAVAKTMTITTGDIKLFSDSFEISDGTNKYNVSLDSKSRNYITKVLGKTNFDAKTSFYVEAMYDNIASKEFVASKSTVAVVIDKKFNNFKQQYQSSTTPWIISEELSGSVEKLFRFVTISDGLISKNEAKVSIVNIDPITKTFDVLVRDYYDSDKNPSIRERFTRCSLNRNSRDFIGSKIGTIDGEYNIKSNYFVLELNQDIELQDFSPSGFMGYPVVKVGEELVLDYKTKYVPEDNRRKVYLGLSNIQGFDVDILNSVGNNTNTHLTNGFAINATTPTIKVDGVEYTFAVAENITNVTDNKFTVVAFGGFDGWDIYRSYRTNEDNFIINKFYDDSGLNVANLAKQGLEPYTMSNGQQGSTADYYAFLEGVRTFSNPEEEDINVLTVGGLDYGKNASLLSEVIEVVEVERQDSIFIMNAPNSPSIEDAIDAMEKFGVTSSYTATFYPWKQYNDFENGVYVDVPVTMDVLRNIADVDNKSVPWYAVAGLQRGDVRCIKALKKLTLGERDRLYSSKINPVQTWAKKGVKIWGNSTLHEDQLASLASLNVRRLVLEAKKLIKNASLRLIFEQNDFEVRDQFKKIVDPILENIRNERGLAEFRVEVSDDVEDIQRRELRARILIKPTPALERIIIEFGVTDHGVNFDDI